MTVHIRISDFCQFTPENGNIFGLTGPHPDSVHSWCFCPGRFFFQHTLVYQALHIPNGRVGGALDHFGPFGSGQFALKSVE